VLTRAVPHVGATNGYRIEWAGASVAYVSDHQEPVGDGGYVAPQVLELCRDVDLLVHDSQFTPEEFAERSTWGHCTLDYALEVARQSGAKRLALFHHDPARDDEGIDAFVEKARARAVGCGVPEVFAASEGLRIALG
jgi:ribonuclease BN (tRNA processing enzyme)